MGVTPDLGSMLKHCAAEGAPGAFSCVAAVAAALPAHSELRRAHERFRALKPRTQARLARDPERAARFVARVLKCRPAGSGRAAWGLIRGEDGRAVFAAGNGAAWYARCEMGIARVHPSRVFAAWEIV